MSQRYKAVDWNRQKRLYDLALALLVALALGSFIGVTLWQEPTSTAETLILRSTSLTALLLLHVILCIGPLARLSPGTAAPLLYNRRHLGATMFALAFVHGGLAIFQYHGLGDTNALLSAFTAYGRDYATWRAGGGLAHVPFEPFGIVALLILFLMAATSHDFWLRNLGASMWKLLHLGVYLAYGLVLVHVALGFLQSETAAVYPALLAVGFVTVIGLHLAAGWRDLAETRTGEALAAQDAGTLGAAGYVPTCGTAELREGRAKVVELGGSQGRAAVWLHRGRVFATSNVCKHQGGPLGEGRILDGCVTCPWHGWNYKVDTGMSPPPFHEVIPTHDVKVHGGTVYVRRLANPLETACAGAARNGRDSHDDTAGTCPSDAAAATGDGPS